MNDFDTPLGEFGQFVFALIVLSLLSMFAPKLAGPFVILIITALAINIHKKGLL